MDSWTVERAAPAHSATARGGLQALPPPSLPSLRGGSVYITGFQSALVGAVVVQPQ